MSGAQGKVKLVRRQASSSSKDPARPQDYQFTTSKTTSFKQPRRNLAEKRLLSLRNKLNESPPEVVCGSKEQKKPIKSGGKRKASEDEVVLDKVKKTKPDLQQRDRRKERYKAQKTLNVQERLVQLKELMGSPLKKGTQKIPKIKRVKCSVEDHSDDDTIIEVDYSLPANKEEPKSVNTSHTFTVVSEATVSGTSPLKQRVKRSKTNLGSDRCITASTSSTIKASNQSSQCTLTATKIEKPSSACAPKSKLSDRLARLRNSKTELPQSPLLSKSTEISNWIESTQPQACSNDVSISDSLMVNTDTTLLQNSMVMTEIQDDDSMEWDACPESYTQPVDSQPTITAVVTDTNVFMHDLGKIRELLEFKGYENVLLYIPFMVLQELDYIKDHNGPYQKCQALAAQRLINKYMTSSNSRLVGQTVDEVCDQQNLGKSPDDKILSCCLQAKTKYPTVILLSNDINLRNKALANNIKAFNSTECLSHLKSTVLQPIFQPLEDLLSKIILHCCQQMFGSTTKHIEMLQNSPWTFKGCLERLKKYWRTVFRDLLLKQSLKSVEELMVLLEKGGSDGADLKKFKSKVKELLFYLQDIAEFSSVIKKVRDDL